MRLASRLKIIASLALLATFSLGVVSVATAGPDADGERAERWEKKRAERATKRLNWALDRLGAEGEQRAALESLAADARAIAVDARKATRPEARALRAELMSSSPDAERAHELVDSLAASHTKTGHALVDVALSAHSILEPEQREMLAARAESTWPAFRGSWFVDNAVARALDSIDADDAQRELVAKHKADLEAEVAALVERRNAIGPRLAKLLRAESADADTAHALADEVSLELTSVAHQFVDATVEINASLDDEQRDQLIQSARERRRGR